MLSISRYEEIASFLRSIPQYTYNQFLNLLLFLHFTFTGEKLDIGQAFGITDTQFQKPIAQRHSRQTYQEREEHLQHLSLIHIFPLRLMISRAPFCVSLTSTDTSPLTNRAVVRIMVPRGV